jgi:hypothetical protein
MKKIRMFPEAQFKTFFSEVRERLVSKKVVSRPGVEAVTGVVQEPEADWPTALPDEENAASLVLGREEDSSEDGPSAAPPSTVPVAEWPAAAAALPGEHNASLVLGGNEDSSDVDPVVPSAAPPSTMPVADWSGALLDVHDREEGSENVTNKVGEGTALQDNKQVGVGLINSDAFKLVTADNQRKFKYFIIYYS